MTTFEGLPCVVCLIPVLFAGPIAIVVTRRRSGILPACAVLLGQIMVVYGAARWMLAEAFAVDVVVPIAILALGAIVLNIGLLMSVLVGVRQQRGRCPKCEYNLRGAGCPECGWGRDGVSG